MVLIRKAGASHQVRPAVCPTVAGSHVSNGQDSARARVRALFDVMGGKPLIVRFSDDRTAILSAEALKFVPITHEV